MKRLKYDKDIYAGIVETGRLIPLSEGALVKNLGDEEALECERFKTSEFEFENERLFDTFDLHRIMMVHAPINSNSWWEKNEGKVYSLKFYNVPVRGD